MVLALNNQVSIHAAEVIGWGSSSSGKTTPPASLTNVVGIAAGGNHALALTSEGRVTAWGYGFGNANGTVIPVEQIVGIAAAPLWYRATNLALTAAGHVVRWNLPTDIEIVPGLANVMAIATGDRHQLALLADGTVTAWGDDTYGQSTIPHGLKDIIAVAAGSSHSVALTASGSIVAWGHPWYGDLNAPAEATNIIAISANGSHSLALRADGTVIGWGNNIYGQADAPSGLSNVVAIAAGSYHSLALIADGTVAGWGRGSGGTTPGSGEATPPEGLANVVAISAGDGFSLALVSDSSGLSAPSFVNSVRWMAVVDSPFFQRVIVKNGATSVTATGLPAGLFLDSSRGIVSGVPDSPGEYGVTLRAANSAGTATQQVILRITLPTPTLGTNMIVMGLGVPSNERLITYSAGVRFAATGLPTGTFIEPDTGGLRGTPTVAGDYFPTVTASNRHGVATETILVRVSPVIGWGANRYGQLVPPADLVDVIEVAAGGQHSLALTSLGQVFAWGDNTLGQCSVPPGLSNVIAIAAGHNHSLALTADGFVFAWGAGQTNGSWPHNGQAQVPDGLSNVVTIEAQGDQSLAVTADGSIVAWGEFQHVDGGGSTYDPVDVPAGMDRVSSVAAGDLQNYAIFADGTLSIWDSDSSSSASMREMNMPKVAAIAPGNITLILTLTGEVLSWGTSWYERDLGQPTYVEGLSNVVKIAAGYDHRVTLDRDGRVTNWQRDPAQSNALRMALTNAVAIASGSEHSLAVVHRADQSSPPVWIGARRWLGMAGFPFQQYLTVLHGAGATVAEGLPAGLSFDSDSRTITGIPDQPGEFDVTLRATNAAGVGTMTARLFVNAPAPLILNRPLTVLGLNLPVDYRIHTHYGDSFGAEGLPPGLSIDSQTGIFSGKPLIEGDFSTSLIASNRHGVTLSNIVLRVTGVLCTTPSEFQQTPAGVRDAISVSKGYYPTLVVVGGGKVIGWSRYDPYGASIPPPDLTNAVAVAAGEHHGLALTADGRVVGWGAGGPGRSNPPHFGQTAIPASATNMVAIAAGDYHSLGLRADGTVIAWGKNDYGQATIPFGLNGFIIAIDAGHGWSVALTADRRVVDWGYRRADYQPPPANLTNAIAIAAGPYGSLALRSDGDVVAWGSTPGFPTRLSNVVAIAAGYGFNTALSSDGKLMFAGSREISSPAFTTNQFNVVAMDGGFSDLMMIVGTPHGQSPPQLVVPPRLIAFQSELFDYAVKAKNEVEDCRILGLPAGVSFDAVSGRISGTPRQAGQYSITITASNSLGLSSKQLVLSVNLPPAPFIQNEGLVVLGQGIHMDYPITSYHTPWLHVTGLPPGLEFNPVTKTISGVPTVAGESAVRMVGSNSANATVKTLVFRVSPVLALGTNANGQSIVPVGLQNIVAVAAGQEHSLALTAGGRVISWGGYFFAEPVPAGLSNVVAISAGALHNLALRADGTVVAWGSDNYGQRRVTAGLSNVVAISAGYYHSLALTASGKVAAWGSDSADQVTIPPGLSNVVAIAAGAYHNVVLTASGEVKAWGQYFNGSAYLPITEPEDLNNVVSITGGRGHDVALFSNGQAQAWGTGFAQTNTPFGLPSLVSLKAYWDRTLGLTSDGKVVGWGNLSSAERTQLVTISNVVDMAPGGFHSVFLLGRADAALPPLILKSTRSSDGFRFSFPTEIGRTYVVERCASLNGPEWLFCGLILGDGTHRTFHDPSPEPEAYFRVRRNPRN